MTSTPHDRLINKIMLRRASQGDPEVITQGMGAMRRQIGRGLFPRFNVTHQAPPSRAVIEGALSPAPQAAVISKKGIAMIVSFQKLQSALKAEGFDPGAIDGAWGPKTLGALMGFVANKKSGPIAEIAQALSRVLIEREITTPLRIVHFLAQAAHESGGFQVLTENLNYSAAGLLATFPSRVSPVMADQLARKPKAIADYVYGDRLGNRFEGDGWRFRGRGIFQITGRANYREMGQALGIDLEFQPDVAATPDGAAKTAGAFWTSRGLNQWADQDNIARITKIINGGNKGLPERARYLSRAKGVWGIN